MRNAIVEFESYGILFDLSCYSGKEEFTGAVWNEVFHKFDCASGLNVAVNLASQEQRKAERFWNSR